MLHLSEGQLTILLLQLLKTFVYHFLNVEIYDQLHLFHFVSG